MHRIRNDWATVKELVEVVGRIGGNCGFGGENRHIRGSSVDSVGATHVASQFYGFHHHSMGKSWGKEKEMAGNEVSGRIGWKKMKDGEIY